MLKRKSGWQPTLNLTGLAPNFAQQPQKQTSNPHQHTSQFQFSYLLCPKHPPSDAVRQRSLGRFKAVLILFCFQQTSLVSLGDWAFHLLKAIPFRCDRISCGGRLQSLATSSEQPKPLALTHRKAISYLSDFRHQILLVDSRANQTSATATAIKPIRGLTRQTPSTALRAGSSAPFRSCLSHYIPTLQTCRGPLTKYGSPREGFVNPRGSQPPWRKIQLEGWHPEAKRPDESRHRRRPRHGRPLQAAKQRLYDRGRGRQRQTLR